MLIAHPQTGSSCRHLLGATAGTKFAAKLSRAPKVFQRIPRMDITEIYILAPSKLWTKLQRN